VQKNAYQNYLKEKKAYEAQLNQETQQRLQRIKNASLELPIIQPTLDSITQAPLEKPTKPVYSKRSILLNYLTLGYLPIRLKNQASNKLE